MEEPKTLYVPEESAKKLSLSQDQKDAIGKITLGIEEVDMSVRARAIPDIIDTLENGHL